MQAASVRRVSSGKWFMDDNQLSPLSRSQSLARPDSQLVREPVVVEVSPEEVPHLLDYWDVIRKRRWVVLACLVILFTTVCIGTLKERAVYEGKVRLEIDPETPSVVDFKEVVSVAPRDVETYQETQFEILESRTLSEKVINDLQLYRNPEFNRKLYLFGLIDGGAAPIPANTDPPDPSSDQYRAAVAIFKSDVDVTPIRRSNLVDLTFDSHDPNLAARVANDLADKYIDNNFQIKYDETMKAREWLETQLGGEKIKLEQSEHDLADYARQNSIVFINDKQTLVTQRLADLQSDYTKSQADRIQWETLYNLVKEGKTDELPGVIDNRVIQDLSEKKDDLERSYEDMLVTVKPEFPKAVHLKRQIDTIDKEINTQKTAVGKNVVNQYNSAVKHEKSLEAAMNQAKEDVGNMGEKGIAYGILQREVESNQQIYNGLLDRMKEAGVTAGLKASNIHVIDGAIVPKVPSKPRVFLNLAVGLILGLGLGVGLAFFQEYLDKTLKTADDVEQLLRLSSLGVLPKFLSNGAHGDAAGIEEDEGRLLALTPTTGGNGHHALAPGVQTVPEVVEAFRSLRTSVLLSASPVPKLILVTSALPSEGKTTTAVNLGATLASLGNKVVVVDCDMRRPACHRSTGVENHPGFVRCLTGHVELSEAVLPVPGVPNLSVIPCGPIPPNPAEVLSSALTGDLLRRLRGQFEYVLVDSPPLLSVADGRILATLVDAVVLVTRAHSTPYDVVRRARALLYGSGARILGVALNAVDMERDGLGYQQYQYGYGHPPAAEDERGGRAPRD